MLTFQGETQQISKEEIAKITKMTPVKVALQDAFVGVNVQFVSRTANSEAFIKLRDALNGAYACLDQPIQNARKKNADQVV